MKQDISVVKSRSVTLTVYLENQDGSPRSLSSDETLIFGVKESLSDTAYKIKKTAGSTNGSNGAYSFTLVPSDTSNLIAPKSYYYDIGLKSGDDYFTVVEPSKFKVEQNVTVKE